MTFSAYDWKDAPLAVGSFNVPPCGRGIVALDLIGARQKGKRACEVGSVLA